MNVTREQLDALKLGEPILVDVGQEECVLLLKTTYDAMKVFLEDPRDYYPAVLKSWDKEGAPDDSQLYEG